MYDFAEYKSLFEKNKWEFSYYLMHKDEQNVSLPLLDLKAKLEFESIDKNRLQEHFLKIIENYEKVASNESERHYIQKTKYIRKKYDGSDFLNREIKNFLKRIFDKVHNDNSIYARSRRKVLDDGISNDINRKIAEYSVELISSLPLHITKLIMITDYKYETEESMLYQKLNKRYVQNRFDSFKDIFSNEEDFNKIINKLIENKDIKSTDYGYQWCQVIDDIVLKPKTLICVFSLTLQNRNYYKINPNNILIVDLLNSFFKTDISYSYFGRIKKTIINFDDKILTNYKDYISHFQNIIEINNNLKNINTNSL